MKTNFICAAFASAVLALSVGTPSYAQRDEGTPRGQSAPGAVQEGMTQHRGAESRDRHEDTQPVSEEQRARDIKWSRKAVVEIEASRRETVAYAIAIRTRDAAAIRKIYREHGIPAELERAIIIFDDHSGIGGNPSDIPTKKFKISVSITVTFHPPTIKADIGGLPLD